MADEAPPKQPTVWAVYDGKIGMASQVLGLAEALGWPFVEKVLKIRAPWRYLSSQFWLNPFSALDPAGDSFESPWPDVLISCGNMTVAPALAAKRASGGRVFWVQIQDPRFARGRADLVVAPSHDPVKGANVFRTLGRGASRHAGKAGRGRAALRPPIREIAAAAGGGADRRQQPRLPPDQGAARCAGGPARRAGAARLRPRHHGVAAHRRGRDQAAARPARALGRLYLGRSGRESRISDCWRWPTSSSSPRIRCRW